MRIDFVTDTFPPDVNGVAMTLGRLVGGLRERGHFIHVLHTADREEAVTGETSLPSVPLPGYKEVRLGLPGRLRFFHRWQKKPPDAIYVATESPLGYSAIKAANMLRIPVAAGFHTNFDQYLDQYHLGGLRQPMLTFLRRVHNRADCTFAPSLEVVERLQNEGFEEVYLLGRGVDTKLFNPHRRDETLRENWGAKKRALVALIVGRVAPEKNLPLAIEAFEKMRDKHPNFAAVVVGDGPVRQTLQEQHPWVHFAGMQQGEALARHYASADILLFPSETETFGNVLIEGLASGLVTVSYDYAAAAKHVVDKKNGLKAPLGEQEQFLNCSLESLEIAKAGEMQKQAIDSVKDLSWTHVIEKFEERLTKMAAGKINARNVQKDKSQQLHYRTIFISDVHLGSRDCKIKELIDFLKHTTCEKLVLNGDIFDSSAFKRGRRWKQAHTKLVRTILKKSEKEGNQVIYLRGNHEHALNRFLPMDFGAIKIVKKYIHTTFSGEKYLVIHGDGLHTPKFVSALGTLGYNALLRISSLNNALRNWQGKPPYSLSQIIKSKAKGASIYLKRYQEQARLLAKKRDCKGIICGHIHTPEDKYLGETHYLNAGDWVESLSAIVEHPDGQLELIFYKDFLFMFQGKVVTKETVPA